MVLSYKIVSSIVEETKGIKEEEMIFQTVSCFSDISQPKGLYVPLFSDSGNLQEAIANGAIAAIWKKGEKIPSYTPNHFPIFYTNDIKKGILDMIKNLAVEAKEANETTFIVVREQGITKDLDSVNGLLLDEKGESSC